MDMDMLEKIKLKTAQIAARTASWVEHNGVAAGLVGAGVAVAVGMVGVAAMAAVAVPGAAVSGMVAAVAAAASAPGVGFLNMAGAAMLVGGGGAELFAGIAKLYKSFKTETAQNTSWLESTDTLVLKRDKEGWPTKVETGVACVDKNGEPARLPMKAFLEKLVDGSFGRDFKGVYLSAKDKESGSLSKPESIRDVVNARASGGYYTMEERDKMEGQLKNWVFRETADAAVAKSLMDDGAMSAKLGKFREKKALENPVAPAPRTLGMG